MTTSYAQLAQMTGQNRRTIAKCLDEMGQKGYVTVQKSSAYFEICVTQKGRDVLDATVQARFADTRHISQLYLECHLLEILRSGRDFRDNQ